MKILLTIVTVAGLLIGAALSFGVGYRCSRDKEKLQVVEASMGEAVAAAAGAAGVTTSGQAGTGMIMAWLTIPVCLVAMVLSFLSSMSPKVRMGAAGAAILCAVLCLVLVPRYETGKYDTSPGHIMLWASLIIVAGAGAAIMKVRMSSQAS